MSPDDGITTLLLDLVLRSTAPENWLHSQLGSAADSRRSALPGCLKTVPNITTAMRARRLA